MNGLQMYKDWLDSIGHADIKDADSGKDGDAAKVGPNQAARDRLAQHLVECEKAKTILRALGYGVPGQTIAAMARLVPKNS